MGWLTKKPRDSVGRVDDDSTANPVSIVQQAIANPDRIGFGNIATALERIVQEELWRNSSDSSGIAFHSFAAFAVAEVPNGLGVRGIPAARLVRHAFLERRLFGPWTELLDLIARAPGGHQPNIVNEEGLAKYYPVSRAMTSRDRLLLDLKHRHPEVFEQMLCEEKQSPYRAAVKIGLVVAADRSRLRFNVCDIEAAQRLPHKVQAKLLREMFRALSLDAQCELIALELDRSLGIHIAKRWRER